MKTKDKTNSDRLAPLADPEIERRWKDKVGQEFTETLKNISDYYKRPTQEATARFPIVTEEERKAAFDAYFDFTHQFGLTFDEAVAIRKALFLDWAWQLAQQSFVEEITLDETTGKINWQ